MIDQNKLDALFVKAKKAPHASVFNETKEQFLIASSDNVDKPTSKKDHFITFNKGIIMLVIAGAIALTCFLMSSDIEETETESRIQTQVELKSVYGKETTQIEREKGAPKSRNSPTVVFSEDEDVSVILDFVSISDLIKKEIKPSGFGVKKKELVEREKNSDFVFPKLTEKEISDNHRRKKKMLKALNKKDKKVYSYIPSGSFTYKSKPISVQAFHMQRTEVTNIEYKTFLFDLLIHDRKEDFLVAKPKQELWTEELGEDYRYMQEDYFSGEEYEDCPVNNINRKGAQMYCNWITNEANEINKANGKPFINDVRIPMRAEWVKAATVEGKFPEYAWASSASKVYFLSNFSLKGFEPPSQVSKKTGETFTVGHQGAITSSSSLNGKNKVMGKSKSYMPNEHGLYNVSGNVAEMVYESDGSNDLIKRTELKSGTAGGGWMNTPEEIKLNAEDLYQGVEDEHLNIGFRIVITYTGSN